MAERSACPAENEDGTKRVAVHEKQPAPFNELNQRRKAAKRIPSSNYIRLRAACQPEKRIFVSEKITQNDDMAESKVRGKAGKIDIFRKRKFSLQGETRRCGVLVNNSTRYGIDKQSLCPYNATCFPTNHRILWCLPDATTKYCIQGVRAHKMQDGIPKLNKGAAQGAQKRKRKPPLVVCGLFTAARK